MGRSRILLADDHALLLGAFEKLLSGEFDVVGQATDGRALVAAALISATFVAAGLMSVAFMLFSGIQL